MWSNFTLCVVCVLQQKQKKELEREMASMIEDMREQLVKAAALRKDS